MLWSTALNIWANLENSTEGTGLEGQFTFQSQRKQCQRMLYYHTIEFISHVSKVMLKILQDRLQHFMNWELPDVQAWFRSGRGTREQIVNVCWIIKKASEFQKNTYFCFRGYTKDFDCVNHNKLWKVKRWSESTLPARAPCLPPEKSACRSRSNSLNWTWNNGMAPNWESSTSRLHIVTLLI